MRHYSVSDVNRFLKQIVASEELLYSIRVEGEISNFVHHRSGHMYFTLKDSSSSIRCVIFKTHATQLVMVPENGMKVIVQGDIQVFERDGVYQLYGRKIQKQGVGEATEALLALAGRLETEGIFSLQRKREIPRFPKSIGVITGEKTAALQDIIHVISRRYPVAELWVYPAVVQGAKAVPSLCKALELAAKKPPELLIIGRGGGSKEDLAAFQAEEVVRAIASFPMPVIAAIGHEIDTTLSDLAADLRAPTPSAAAEMATPDLQQVKENINELRCVLSRQLGEQIHRYNMQWIALEQRLRKTISAETLSAYREHLCFLDWRLSQQMRSKWSNASAEFSHRVELLTSASPMKILKRGYAIACTEDNAPIISAQQLQTGSVFSLRFNDGEITATVIKNDN